MNVKMMAGAFLLAAVGTGCVGSKVHFADVPADKVDFSRGQKVVGKASGLSLFEIIPIRVNGRQARAYERMKDAAPCAYLADIKVQDSWRYAFIGIKYNTVITAMAYPEKSASAPVPAVPAHAVAQTLSQKLHELQDLREKGLLTDAEYEAARKKALSN